MSDYFATVEEVKRALGYSDPTLSDDAVLECIMRTDADIRNTINYEVIAMSDPRWGQANAACVAGALSQILHRQAGGTSEGVDYSIYEYSVKKSKGVDAKGRNGDWWYREFQDKKATLKTEQIDLPTSTDYPVAL